MSFSERFRRRRGPEQAGSHEVEKLSTTKPFHTFIAGEQTSAGLVIEQQRKTITAMLEADETGHGKVVVMVDNPMWINQYSGDIRRGMDEGKTFTQAERDSFRDRFKGDSSVDTTTDEQCDAIIARSKSAISVATGELIDELRETHPDRIVVCAPIVSKKIDGIMHKMIHKGFDPYYQLETSLSQDAVTDDDIDEFMSYIKLVGNFMNERDTETAKSLRNIFTQDQIIGGVSALSPRDVGFADALTAEKDTQGTHAFSVEMDLGDATSWDTNDRIRMMARDETLTANHIREALQKPLSLEQQQELWRQEVERIDLDEAESLDRVLMDSELAAMGVVWESPKEEDPDTLAEKVEERMQPYMERLAQAEHILTHGTDISEEDFIKNKQKYLERLAANQLYWESVISNLTAEHLDSEEPTIGNTKHAREKAEKDVLELTSAIVDLPILDKNFIGPMMLVTSFEDPTGVFERSGTQSESNELSSLHKPLQRTKQKAWDNISRYIDSVTYDISSQEQDTSDERFTVEGEVVGGINISFDETSGPRVWEGQSGRTETENHNKDERDDRDERGDRGR